MHRILCVLKHIGGSVFMFLMGACDSGMRRWWCIDGVGHGLPMRVTRSQCARTGVLLGGGRQSSGMSKVANERCQAIWMAGCSRDTRVLPRMTGVCEWLAVRR
ncbi:hypothetical protein BCR44DRAFT_1424141 [Catenaria anguillulae PL171]|uniref:Secreted protein n=1 Tax=Catenaria anguillulae PL171 TaxID=765915 RepID=A0A1Y2I647_9FUNG|nr:hypothetical protein BCR44DRAFT_1424141 [Catenaria anguillulae PL171]